MGWLGPLVGAGSTIASLFGSDDNNFEMPEGAQPFLDSLDKTSDIGGRFGKKFLKRSNKAFQLPMDFWKKIMTGDRSSLTNLLSPEVEKISGGYDNVKRNIGEFGPRGGGSNSALTNLDIKETGDISRLFQTARPMAAQNLAQLGSAQGGIGLGALGLGVNADQAGLGAIFDNQRMGQNAQAGERDYYGNIGQGLGGWLSKLFPTKK